MTNSFIALTKYDWVSKYVFKVDNSWQVTQLYHSDYFLSHSIGHDVVSIGNQ